LQTPSGKELHARTTAETALPVGTRVHWLLLSHQSFPHYRHLNRINVVNFELTIDMTRQLDDELMLLYTMRATSWKTSF